ncbi:MAG: nucleotidyltransferase family protein [Fibrobacter sp.]|nr:nucleotidyltransferase family protein [Fibrobacter sp.]
MQTVTYKVVARRVDLLFALLRYALGASREFPVFGAGDVFAGDITAEDWEWLYKQCGRQSLLGVAFFAINSLSSGKPESIGMPRQLYLKWYYQAEGIRSLNERHYACSRELTQKFAAEGCLTLILKGQANSLLYPDKFIRQTGDIDIWVSGGRERVLEVLRKMDLLEDTKISSHDVLLPKKVFGEEVEVHFGFGVDRCNPFANRRLLHFLNAELPASHPVPAGDTKDAPSFYVPSNKFALVMQLSHIYKHMLGLGVGMRQLVDYFLLLRASSGKERTEIASLLGAMNLRRFAGALMWVLTECLGLESEYLLCPPDARRGRILLREIMRDGNFGKFADRRRGSVWRWWLKNRLRLVTFLPFDLSEVSWFLLRYWASFVFLTPKRILALRRYKERHK